MEIIIIQSDRERGEVRHREGRQSEGRQGENEERNKITMRQFIKYRIIN